MLGYYRKAAEPSRLVALSFGLLLGGAVGNLIDRVRHSFVGDFIDFQVWPVFNVADASITIGLFILVGLFLLSQRAERVAALKAQAESESGPVSEEGQSKKEREGPSPVNKPSPGPPA